MFEYKNCVCAIQLEKKMENLQFSRIEKKRKENSVEQYEKKMTVTRVFPPYLFCLFNHKTKDE